MKIIFIAFLIFALVVGAAVLLALKTKEKKQTYGYKRKRPLTNNEQAMYWKLVKTLPDFIVLAQVAMSSVIKTNSRSAHLTIAQKSIDFVICDQSFLVIAAIEIDDKSHEKAERQKADRTKNTAFENAKIALIRWPAVPLPDTSEILTKVLGAQNEKH